MIYFKIFIHSQAQKVKYMSGRKMIKPASEVTPAIVVQSDNTTSLVAHER